MEVVKHEVDQEQAKREAAQQKGPLTREQRRARERLNEEVTEMINRLVRQWYQFFINNDPDSEVVKNKQKEVSAKWRMFCRMRHLKVEAFPLVDKSIAGFIEEYKKAKG